MSANFSFREFRSHDGREVPPEYIPNVILVMGQIEIIRHGHGGPIEVVSGWRSEAWNVKKGGAKLSYHLTGDAADIRPIIKVAGVRVPWALVTRKRERIAEFHSMILRMVQEGELSLVGGLGFYDGKWAHIDIRVRPTDGHLAQWTGTGIGAEQVA